MKIVFGFLFLVMLTELSFAAPGIKITQPLDNSIVKPNQEITVTVEAVEGFSIVEGGVGAGDFFLQKFEFLPAIFNIKIPKESVGQILVWVSAEDASKHFVKDTIILKVEQIATLQSLLVEPDELSVNIDWNGNIKGNEYIQAISVDGVYSDGVTRDLNKDPNTTYLSSDPAVASVDTKGEVHVHKVGEAKIIVSNLGVSKDIPVVFKEPGGIRPSETIPPTINLSTQPLPNQAGWNKSDITITLTAQDNPGGSGIKEIVYSFPSLSAESNFVEGDQAVIPFSEEGENLFRYGASDKEGNNSGQQSTKIRIDKTPPQTTVVISPPPDVTGWIRSLPVKVTFTATDNLSGVAYTTPEKIFTEAGTYQVDYYSTDIAGNKEETKTVTIKIEIADTTPPELNN